MDRYINQEDLMVIIDAEIEYAKLIGNFEKVRNFDEIKEQIVKMTYLEFPKPRTDTEPIMYRHTEERE